MSFFLVVTSIQHPHTSACDFRQTLGCNPVFTTWAPRLRRDRQAVNDFLGDFGRIWHFWHIFTEVRGVFSVGNFVGLFIPCGVLGGLEVEEFFGEKYEQTLGLWVVRMGI